MTDNMILAILCAMIAAPLLLVWAVGMSYIWVDVALGWHTSDFGESAALRWAFRLMPFVSLAAGAVTYYRMQP